MSSLYNYMFTLLFHAFKFEQNYTSFTEDLVTALLTENSN